MSFAQVSSFEPESFDVLILVPPSDPSYSAVEYNTRECNGCSRGKALGSRLQARD